jgi:hypothetical protein
MCLSACCRVLNLIELDYQVAGTLFSRDLIFLTHR